MRLSRLSVAIVCTLGTSQLSAAPPANSADPPPEPAPLEPEVDPASPRAAMQRYVTLCKAGDYVEAARLLDAPQLPEPERRVLARRLKAVLDRHAWLDLEKVSDKKEGNLGDGLPAPYEQVGTIPQPSGEREPVRLVRRAQGQGWLFSRSTVGKIDAWYDALPDRWFLENLPAALLRPGPRNLLWWQWLGLASAVLVSGAIAFAASSLLRAVLRRGTAKTSSTWDDRLLLRLRGPVTLALSLAVARALLPLLFLYAPAEGFIRDALRAGFFTTLLWVFWRLVDVAAQAAWDSSWSFGHPASRALIPLLRRVGKTLVGVAALLLFIKALGYPITSLIAGLGIGGLALALASQKTVENLFGAFSLGIDQPFREGDFVRVEDVVGTVEALGLRSTRIRTLDRTLVTIPNGKLADMRLETFAARDRLRLACVVRLVYGTTAAQLRSVLGGVEAALRAEPKLWPDSLTVRLRELGVSSLDIEVMAWFTTSDWDEFMLIRQELLLEFLAVVERSGTSFAPAQVVQVAPAVTAAKTANEARG